MIEKLGLSLPQIQRDLKSRIFLTSFHNIESSRIDPLFLLCWGKEVASSIYKSIKLCSISEICKGNALTSKEIIPGAVPVIAGGQTSPYFHNESNYSGNVITVSASGAYAGYVWYHEGPIYATDCNVIYSQNEDSFLTKFIYEVLRVQQEYIYYLQINMRKYLKKQVWMFIQLFLMMIQQKISLDFSCKRHLLYLRMLF